MIVPIRKAYTALSTQWPDLAWQVGFFLTFLGGSYLRFHALTFQSYWNDELFSAAVSAPSHSLREVVRLTVNDVHPPLFQVLLWLWFKLFGFSELAGRLFPAVFGSLSIFVMFLLGSEIGNKKVGFLCALLCALNIFHIRYSQEVRSYSTLFFFSALSLLYFFRLLREGSWLNMAGYVASTVALAYIHFFGEFVVLAEVLFFVATRFFRDKSGRLIGLRVGMALCLLMAPLVSLIIKNAGISAFWITPPPGNFLIKYFNEYFGSFIVADFMIVMSIYGAVRFSRTRCDKDLVHFLWLCLVMVLVLPYVKSLIGTPLLTSRNTIVGLPLIFVLSAIGFAEIKNHLLQALGIMAFVMLSLFVIFHQPSYYQAVKKPQIREVAQALMAINPEPGAIYAAPEVVENFNTYFLLLDAPLRVQSVDQLLKPNGAGTRLAKFWLVDGRPGGPAFDRANLPPETHVLQEQRFVKAGLRLLELPN